MINNKVNFTSSRLIYNLDKLVLKKDTPEQAAYIKKVAIYLNHFLENDEFYKEQDYVLTFIRKKAGKKFHFEVDIKDKLAEKGLDIPFELMDSIIGRLHSVIKKYLKDKRTKKSIKKTLIELNSPK